MYKLQLLIFVTLFCQILAQQRYYVQQCAADENTANECLRDSANRLVYYLRQGVPELEMIEIEPVLIDEIGIVLGSGPDGYRAVFSNIEAYGVSNISITEIASNLETLQFRLTCEIPHIRVRAQYRSSGVLIMMRATGQGQYWGEYSNVKAKIYFKATRNIGEDGLTYLSAENVKMDFAVKDIKMGVDNIADNNSVIRAALNLFINSNAQELLKEMKPALKLKLTGVIRSFIDRLFEKIPLEAFVDFNE